MERDIFWAKKNCVNGRYCWLPLRQHLKDTRYIIGRLWELWLDESQRNLIENSLQGVNKNGKSLAMFIATTHDIGKCSPAFQLKSSFGFAEDLDNILIEKLEYNGFIGLKEVQLPFISKSHHAKVGQTLLKDYGVNEDIASIVGAHHGKPIDNVGDIDTQLSAYASNYFQIQDEENEIHKKWKKEQRDIFDWALEINGYADVNQLPRIKQNGQVILTGLLIMADWISSNEKYFSLIDIDEYKVDDEDNRYKNAWETWHKTFTWIPDKKDINDIYKERFAFNNPRDAQKKLTKIIEECREPGIIIFEAPMGLGKTETSLVAVEQLAYKMNKSGMFFGLPTQATSNGIFPRVTDWLEKVSDDYNEKMQIRLSHGKAALNEIFENLAKNIDAESGAEGTLIVNEWFSGRKTACLDSFVVGTVDQLLMIALKQKHLPLRHLGFSNKVVIIDEVHAYDVYSSEYLFMAIKWLASYNVPVVILSATLPAEKREKLIRNYMNGKGQKWKNLNKENCDFYTDSYPLVTYSDGLEVKQFSDFEEEKNFKDIQIILEKSENIFNIIDGLSKNGGVIGIVVNTVRKAQNIAKKLTEIYGEEYIELLHSSFLATDRIKKEENLLNIIGKDCIRPDFKIIIGTQVIEQSLDIDFDVMISDFAPIDLLLQRIGRLHRHNIHRLESYAIPTLYVLDTSPLLEFESGTVAIYDEYILTRSQYFLPKTIRIPQDISSLVQKVYGSEDLCLDENLTEIYKNYKEKVCPRNCKKESDAKKFMIHEPSFKENMSLIGWLNNMGDTKTEEKAKAQVRDIRETIEVIGLKKINNGYGMFGTNEDISLKISEFNIAKEVSKNTLRLPSAITIKIDEIIRYLEEYNYKNLSQWQRISWLKGSLGIIFDENNEFELCGYKLTYSEKFGLEYERLGKDVKNE